MSEWKIPKGKGLTIQGANQASVEHFKDDIIYSLTREVLQNSIDAKNDAIEDEPVKIKFKKFKINPEQIPGINFIKDEVVANGKKYWSMQKNKDVDKLIKQIETCLSQEKISVLKISDYNTKGLNDAALKSLAFQEGASHKDSDSAAGSKGIGKAAPFAASDLRMVFYNSLAMDNTEKSVGSMMFVSFEDSDRNITQDKIFYAKDFHEAFDKQFCFDGNERSAGEYGTDVFIIGFQEEENWENHIIISTINNFLVSLHQNKLMIEIQDKSLKSENIADYFTYFEENEKKLNLTRTVRKELKSTYKFYDVLTNPESKKIYIPKKWLINMNL